MSAAPRTKAKQGPTSTSRQGKGRPAGGWNRMMEAVRAGTELHRLEQEFEAATGRKMPDPSDPDGWRRVAICYDYPRALELCDADILDQWNRICCLALERGPAKRQPPVFPDLLMWARRVLKGNQPVAVEMVCQAGGEVPLADLALKFEWESPFDDKFNSLRAEVGKKLKAHKMPYIFERHESCARIRNLPGEKSSRRMLRFF